MSKVLSVNDLIEAAETLAGEEGSGVDSDAVATMVQAMEAAAEELAQYLATARNLECSDVTSQTGFGGLCATFHPGPNGETCDVIGDLDEGGDWEFADPDDEVGEE